MSDGRNKLIARSAKLFNKAASVFYSFPERENGFVPEQRELIRAYNHQRPYGPAPILCYAPFSNIFFNTEGRAIVCCKNTKVVLGEYPGQSIHDMWFGSKTALLRDNIRHHDLSHGCYKCREALHSGNFGSLTASGFDFVRAWPASEYPRLMEFELSNVCNLECAMCSGRVSSSIRKNREHREPLKMLYDLDFAHQLNEFIPHLKQARFYGGEPFLIEIYYEIWSRMIAANPAINLYVLTNGTILNDRIKSLLSQGNFTLNVSMDSFRKETYEAIRKNARYEETLENLHYFKDWMKSKGKKLNLFVTPTRLNWQEIPDMVEQCDRWEIEVYFSTAYFPAGLTLWDLAVEQIDEIITAYKSRKVGSETNRERFEHLIADLEYWGASQRNNPRFLKEFSEESVEQEQIHLMEKPLLDVKNAEGYRNTFYARLSECGLASGSEMAMLKDKLDRAIVLAEVEPGIIYYFLQQLRPEVFMTQVQKMPDIEIPDFLRRKQAELLEAYQVIH